MTRRVPLGHPDFSEVFDCRCTLEKRKLEQAEARRKYANLPKSDPPKTFENLENIMGLTEAIDAARAYADNLQQPSVLTFYGLPGCGKSHLLEAIGRCLIERGVICKYASGPVLLDELRNSYDADSSERFQEVFDRYNRAEVLLLDDPGAERPSAWTMEKFYLLVNNRIINGRGLVVGTNLSFEKAREQLGPRTADRIWDTGSGTAQVVVITAPSYRTARLAH